MTIVTFNKKQFEKEIGKLTNEMQNRISMFGTPIEEITSNEIKIEVFPNRPDLLPYHRFKRAFLAFLGKKIGMKNYIINPPKKEYEVIVDSSVSNVRPYTACAIVKKLSFDDEKIKELIETQEKLHFTIGRKRKKVAIGIYPLEKISLPITLKAMEPDQIKFIPLEMEKELSGLEILQKHPAGKEYAPLLAGKAKFPVFIDSQNQILSMPPIINSNLTGRVTPETKEVFIECSGFDFEVLKSCLNIIIISLAEMGGEIYSMNIKYKNTEITPNLTPKKMKISFERANKILGLDLKEKDFKKLLERMEYNIKQDFVEIPAWRTDILHEIDIIEDLAIAYGYENFCPEIPKITTMGKEDKKEVLKNVLSLILSGINMIEVSNYHLTSEKDQLEKMGIIEKNENPLKINNAKTEYNMLRKNLSHLLLKTLSENIDSEYPQEIFELGKIFRNEDNKNQIFEEDSLALAISPGNYTKAKQVLEYLFRMANQKVEVKEPEKTPSFLIEGRTAEIIFKEKKIGFVGEVHPRILKNWKIKMPVAILEIKVKELFEELLK